MYKNTLATQAFMNKVIHFIPCKYVHHVSYKRCVFFTWIDSQVLETHHIALRLHVNRIAEYWIDSFMNHIIYVWIVSSNSLTSCKSYHWILNRFIHESYRICLNRFIKLSDLVWIDSCLKWIVSNLILDTLSRFKSFLTRIILHHILPFFSLVLYGLNRFTH